MKWWHS